MLSQASVILFTGVCVADTPLGRHPPWTDTPQQTHPLADTPLDRHPPADTPPGQTPPGQTPPADTPWADTSPRDCYYSGRYASYWNAFLFGKCFIFSRQQLHDKCSDYEKEYVQNIILHASVDSQITLKISHSALLERLNFQVISLVTD